MSNKLAIGGTTSGKSAAKAIELKKSFETEDIALVVIDLDTEACRKRWRPGDNDESRQGSKS
jgi:hypothetical protein